MNLRALIILVLILSLTQASSAQIDIDSSDTYIPEWESLNTHNPDGGAAEWIMDAKFGIYFHWGAYSVPAFRYHSLGEWYPRFMHVPGHGVNKHHIEKYGNPAEWPYHNFINGAYDKKGNWVKFQPVIARDGGNFDPEAWAELFRAAGARFAGPCAEHHDGYSLWNSEVNEWNSFNKTGLDIVGQITTAIKNKGLKVVTTFHHAYPIVWSYYPEEDPDYWPSKCKETGDTSLMRLYGKLPKEQSLNLWMDKLQEVIDNYRPDYIWHDVGLRDIDEDYKKKYLAYYYNKSLEWGKDVVVTYKNNDLNHDCAVYDFEGGGSDDVTEYVWVNDQNLLKGTWSYIEGIDYFTSSIVIHSLITIASKNGVLLLNVSPRSDGTIPDEQKSILNDTGHWLSHFGESIYNTRPWATYGEGPTQSGGYGAMKECTSQDIRFTISKDSTILYAIFCGWPGKDEKVSISTLKKGNIDLSELVRAELFDYYPGTYIEIDYSQDVNGLNLKFADEKPYEAVAYPLKLTFKNKIPATGILTKEPLIFTENGWKGEGILLPEGNYTTRQLAKRGIKDNTLTGFRINAGWEIELFEDDDFSGKSIRSVSLTKNVKLLDKDFEGVSSLRIRKLK